MEKKMEATIVGYRIGYIIGYILRLYRENGKDNGKENGNYRDYWGYIGSIYGLYRDNPCSFIFLL